MGFYTYPKKRRKIRIMFVILVKFQEIKPKNWQFQNPEKMAGKERYVCPINIRISNLSAKFLKKIQNLKKLLGTRHPQDCKCASINFVKGSDAIYKAKIVILPPKQINS